MATQLVKLKINEISGVDAPANEEDGWAVLKSRLTPEQREAVGKALGEAETVHAALAEALAGLGPYLSDADEDVRNAAVTLAEYCKSVVEDVGDYDKARAEEASVLEKLADAFRAVFKRGGGDEAAELRKAVLDALGVEKQTLVWGDGETYESVREAVCTALAEVLPSGNGRWSYVNDVDVAESRALVCVYEEGEGGDQTYVASFTRDADGAVELAPRSEWTAARRAWVLDEDE